MSFSVRYDKQPEKFLLKLPVQQSTRIVNKLESVLKDNPVPTNADSIKGEHGVFRLRIGDFRALYRIDYAAKLIIILKIDKRPRVYD